MKFPLILLCLLMLSCQSQKKEVKVIDGLEYYEEATIEGLLSALENDSVEAYMEPRCKSSFQLIDGAVNFFPVSLSSFTGILFYAKGVEPRSLSLSTDDWDLTTLAALGNTYTQYYRPVYYARFKQFVDSLSGHYEINYPEGANDSTLSPMARFNLGKGRSINISHSHRRLEIFLVSLKDSS